MKFRKSGTPVDSLSASLKKSIVIRLATCSEQDNYRYSNRLPDSRLEISQLLFPGFSFRKSSKGQQLYHNGTFIKGFCSFKALHTYAPYYNREAQIQFLQMDSQDAGFYAALITGDVEIDELSMQDQQYGNPCVQQSDISTQRGSSSRREKRSCNFSSEEDITTQPRWSSRRGRRSRGYSSEEDDLIVSAWLNISLDAIHSTDQKMDRYWERVHEFFHSNKTFTSNRSSISLMNRWSVIQKAVNKFCGCYAQIDGRNQSGITEHDKIIHAKAMYATLHKASFTFESCWNRLKLEPKWLVNGEKQSVTTGEKKKRKKDGIPCVEDSSAPDSTNLEDENTQNASCVKKPRPTGKKLELEQMKNKKTKEDLDGTIIMLMEEMKEEKQKSGTIKIELLEKLLAIEAKKETAELRKEEERIMAVDVTGMPPLQAEYYIQRQKEIIEKLQK